LYIIQIELKMVQYFEHQSIFFYFVNFLVCGFLSKSASYLKGYNCEKEFIATQGPRPTSKDDFWRMVWQENCRNIVMLTLLKEHGK